MMMHKRTFILLAAISLIFSGCLRDDLDGCPSDGTAFNVTLWPQYHYDGSANLFSQKVEKVDVQIYDLAGNLVTSVTRNDTGNAQSNGIKLQLDPGDYRIVCWGNMLANSVVSCSGGLLSSTVTHTSQSSGTALTDDPMYYAPRITDLGSPEASALYLTVPSEGKASKVVDFTAAHNTIEVFVSGFRSSGVDTDPRIEVSPLASAYDYHMCTMAGPTMCFSQVATARTISSKEYSVAKFNTVLFGNSNSINIAIKHPVSGSTVHTIALAQYLTDNSIALRSGDWNYIAIYVEFNDLGAVVTVAPWGGAPVTPGI